MSLYERIVAFSRPILDEWVGNQTEHLDAEVLQQQYLYSMGRGALLTSMSCNKLIAENKFHDTPVLARVLLERYLKADFARQDEKNAVSLLIHEASEQIKHLKKYIKSDSRDSTKIESNIEEHEKEIEQMKGLVGGDYTKGLNIFRVSELCDLDWMYRGAYHLMSRHAHAGFHSGLDNVEADSYIQFLIYSTPVEISSYLHYVVNGKSADGHESLKKDISAASFDVS